MAPAKNEPSEQSRAFPEGAFPHFNEKILFTTSHHTQMSTETSITASKWRLVEAGRIIYVSKGKYSGKLAVIVEIIDQRRVLVDGPTTGVPRQALSLNNLVLTPLTIEKFPRGARNTAIAKQFKAQEIEKKWLATSWAKKIAQRKTRASLSDFDRFKVSVLKKERKLAAKKL